MAFLRKEGRYWQVYFYYDGKKHRRSTRTADRSLAHKIMRKIEDDLSANRFNMKLVDERGVLLYDFLDTALEYSRTNKSPETYEREQRVVEKFKDFTGNVNIRRVDARLIEAFKQSLSGKLTNGGINLHLRHLSALFALAVMPYAFLHENPFRHVKKMPKPKLLPKFMTREQTDKLLGVTKGTVAYAPILLSLNTGARISEVCRLHWNDIDLKERTVTLFGKGSKQRKVPVNEVLYEHLNGIEDKSGYYMKSSRDRTQVEHTFRKYADKKGVDLQEFTFHSLRHTFASWLAQAGVQILTLKSLLGHETIQTTMVYAHLNPSNLKYAVEKLHNPDGPKMTLKIGDGTDTGTGNEKSATNAKSS